MQPGVYIANALLGAILFAIVWNRYSWIVRIRNRMQDKR